MYCINDYFYFAGQLNASNLGMHDVESWLRKRFHVQRVSSGSGPGPVPIPGPVPSPGPVLVPVPDSCPVPILVPISVLSFFRKLKELEIRGKFIRSYPGPDRFLFQSRFHSTRIHRPLLLFRVHLKKKNRKGKGKIGQYF